MNQQPDKLFREKLEGYQKPAPASAWEKIAAAQTKKNDKGLWLKIAASILLAAVAAYLLLPGNNSTNISQPSLTEAATQKKDETTSQQQKPISDIPTEVKDEPAPIAKRETTQKRKTVKKSMPEVEQTVIVAINEETKPQNESMPLVEHNNIVVSPLAEIEVAVTETQTDLQPAQQGVTLVFTAEDVDEYLDKKALAEATSDSKKSSTLKKLLKKANDLTNNQDPFGELRQKKNEILALNFKSEKQRGQNK
jgi:hypothetical protein